MTVLYRKYRPQKFADLVGQETIAKTLLAQLESGKIGHGYLFFGPRGTGKTSAARIFAKAVNCRKSEAGSQKSDIRFGEPCNKCISCTSITDGSNLDLIEIDAASNRGIDEIRDLREKIKLSPVSSTFKVYIIDEAHMLTSEAFNALLKTLEEPPAHAIFILATTEMNKLPQTIVSRLQKFNFGRAGRESLERVVEKIAKAENIKIAKGVLGEIAEASDGSFRDALSILDQVAASKTGEIRDQDVIAISKVSSWNSVYNFCENLAFRKLNELVNQLEESAANGADMLVFAKQTVLFLEKVLFVKVGISVSALENYSSEQLEKMRELSTKFTSGDLQRLLRLFLIGENEMKVYPLPQIPLVLAVFKYAGDRADKVEGVEKEEGGSGHEVVKSEKSEEVSEKGEVDSEELTAKTRGVESSIKQEITPRVKNDGWDLDQKVKAKKSTKGKVLLSKVEENWGSFLNKVREVNVHVVALLRSTKPSSFDGEFLTLEVFYRFHKEKLEEPKIIKMLDLTLSEILNAPVKFRFSLAAKGAMPTKAVQKSNVVDIKEEELEKIAQEIFAK